MRSRPAESRQVRAHIVTFASVTSGVGRTAAIANLAVILAAAGRRVLVVDWTSESVAVDDYLGCFPAETIEPPQEIVDSAERILSGVAEPVEGSTWQTVRYRLPEEMGHIHLVSRAERWRGWMLPEWPDRTAECARLGGMLRSAGYDDVLIDGPTTIDDAVAKVIAELSDMVIVTFLMGRITIEAAASLARRLHDGKPTLRLVPLPCQVDLQQRAALERERARVAELFAPFGDVPTDAEIPYRPFDLLEGILVTLADEPGGPQRLTPAYERLAEIITDGRVRTLSPLPRATRERYRQAVGLSERSEAELLSLVYAPQDRAWADWVADQLRHAGAQVETTTGTPRAVPGRLIVINSPDLPDAARWVDAQPARDASPVLVTVAAAAPPGGQGHEVHQIRLAETTEDRARNLLLSHFNFLDPRPRAGFGISVTAGFPAGDGPRYVNLPPSTGEFVGREPELESVRDRLREREADARAVLTGGPGLGKSALALRYALRFRGDYRIVWWLNAADATTAREGLSTLGAELRVDPAGDLVGSVLAALAKGKDGPWLLIYDDVGDAAEIATLVPADGPGHVIMTGRAAAATGLELPPLDAADGAELLIRRAGPIGEQRADRITRELGGSPFALNLAAAWLEQTIAWLRTQGVVGVEDAAVWAAAEFLARLDQVQADRVPVGCLAVTLGSLRDTRLGRLTLCLVELCAWLSPEGIGIRLLGSAPFLAELQSAFAEEMDAKGEDVGDCDLAIDSFPLEQAIWTAARYGLAEITRGGQPTLRLARATQEAARAWMGPDRSAARRAQVRRALAALAPADMDPLGEKAAVYQELCKHLHPAGAAESTDPQVRRWLVNYLRHVGVAGDLRLVETTVELAERLLRSWQRRGLADDPLTLRLHRQLATLLRRLGDYEGALQHSRHALVESRRTLGLTHPRTLITARGMAADLRGLGRYREALAEDRAAYAELARELGEDHPETLLNLHDLAYSAFLTGDRETALAASATAYRQRVRQRGQDDWQTLWIQRVLIDFEREHRRTADSLNSARWQLVDIRQKIRTLHPGRRPDEFRCTRSLAITDRLLGRPGQALASNREALDGFRQLLGPRHPDTFAVRLSLAADLNALGQHEEAIAEARAALDGFGDLYQPQHPVVALCQTDLAKILLDVGQVAEALELARQASSALEEELGRPHPWTMAARVNHSRALAASGATEAALDLDELTHEDAVEFLSADHPYAQPVAEALEDSRRRQADDRYREDPLKRPALYLDVPSP